MIVSGIPNNCFWYTQRHLVYLQTGALSDLVSANTVCVYMQWCMFLWSSTNRYILNTNIIWAKETIGIPVTPDGSVSVYILSCICHALYESCDLCTLRLVCIRSCVAICNRIHMCVQLERRWGVFVMLCHVCISSTRYIHKPCFMCVFVFLFQKVQTSATVRVFMSFSFCCTTYITRYI